MTVEMRQNKIRDNGRETSTVSPSHAKERTKKKRPAQCIRRGIVVVVTVSHSEYWTRYFSGRLRKKTIEWKS